MRTLLVGLRVTDLDRSLSFYKALGYTELGHVPETMFGSLTMLQLPDDPFATLELVHDLARPVDKVGGFNHLAIKVENLAATIADLAAKGVRADPAQPTAGPNEPLTTMLTDPDGYLIELVQWPEEHPDGITVADFEAGKA